MTVYEEIVKAWTLEQSSDELQQIKSGFFKETAGYIRRLRESLRNLDQKSLKALVIQDELARLDRLIRQLVDIRLEKAWKAARTGGGLQAQPDIVEKESYQSFMEVARYYERLKEDVSHGREPQSFQGPKKERLTVRFLKDVPSIIGVDLRTYGPFQKEDVAIVPYENAESLIKQGAAAEVMATLTNPSREGK